VSAVGTASPPGELVEDVAQREQEQVHVTRWGVGTEHVTRECLSVEVSLQPVRGSVSLG
jgi:hypothetical protein